MVTNVCFYPYQADEAADEDREEYEARLAEIDEEEFPVDEDEDEEEEEEESDARERLRVAITEKYEEKTESILNIQVCSSTNLFTDSDLLYSILP